jgi:hypothetical protein
MATDESEIANKFVSQVARITLCRRLCTRRYTRRHSRGSTRRVVVVALRLRVSDLTALECSVSRCFLTMMMSRDLLALSSRQVLHRHPFHLSHVALLERWIVCKILPQEVLDHSIYVLTIVHLNCLYEEAHWEV